MKTTTKHHLSQYQPYRQKHVYKDGDTVFAWNDNKGHVKVGSTNDMNKTEDEFFRDTSSGEMAMTLLYSDTELFERVVHHMLLQRGKDVRNDKGWYRLPVENVIDVMVSLHAFLECRA